LPRELVIDSNMINDDSDCWVIAEIGHNHQGDINKAKEMFHKAKECGVNAVKLQKRDNKALSRPSSTIRPMTMKTVSDLPMVRIERHWSSTRTSISSCSATQKSLG